LFGGVMAREASVLSQGQASVGDIEEQKFWQDQGKHSYCGKISMNARLVLGGLANIGQTKSNPRPGCLNAGNPKPSFILGAIEFGDYSPPLTFGA
jgi:hypothetical protein